MKYTFLGHQGWLVESADFRLLLDPVVEPYFRNSQHSKVWVYPPRRLALERVAPIDAVYISHEHEDHFHVPSLAAVDRKTQMFLSGNVSAAAQRILEEMGFERVQRVYAMERLPLGRELIMTLLPPPSAALERWVLQPFICGRDPRDSFFNPVDCLPSPQLAPLLEREQIQQLGVVCMANNMQIAPSVIDTANLGPVRRRELGQDLEPARVLTTHLRFGALPRTSCFAIVGGGFIDETAPFGLHHCGSQRRLAEVLSEYSHGQLIVGPEPGETLELEGGHTQLLLAEPGGIVAASPEGNQALERAKLLSEAYRPEALRTYEAVTGRRDLSTDELSELDTLLQGLAPRLGSTPLHIELMQHGASSDSKPSTFRDGKLLLRLLVGSGAPEQAVCWEYQPARCAFVRVPTPPAERAVARYPFGFECWAADLKALLSGELVIYEVIKYRCRYWVPQQRFANQIHVISSLEALFAPELWPEQTHRFYASAWRRHQEATARRLAAASPGAPDPNDLRA